LRPAAAQARDDEKDTGEDLLPSGRELNIEPPLVHYSWTERPLHERHANRVTLGPQTAERSRSEPTACRAGDQLALAALGGDNADENDARPPSTQTVGMAARSRLDLDTCPRCGGPMRWVEAALGPHPVALDEDAEHGRSLGQSGNS